MLAVGMSKKSGKTGFKKNSGVFLLIPLCRHGLQLMVAEVSNVSWIFGPKNGWTIT